MNIGLFGGTFDPIHRGHTALAHAARDAFQLARIHFVPASNPPHKPIHALASYFDRYAMVTLATSGEKTFAPSLLEAPEAAVAEASRGKKPAQPQINYSIDTIRSLKQTFKKADRLFFLIGMDAFKDIAKWHQAHALFGECEFVVASRPGYSLADVANSLPEKLRPSAAVTKPFTKHAATGDLVLPGVTVHLLEDVHEKVSATAVRDAVRAKRPLGKLVEPSVAEYISKMGLYKNR